MRVIVLGSAALGGFPQWNCGCPNRRGFREGTLKARKRTQSCIAISPEGERWYLIDASPDLGHQIEATRELHPSRLRESKIHAVLLTHAHPDHVLGLPAIGLGGVVGETRTLIYGTRRTKEYLLSKNTIFAEGIDEENWVEISLNKQKEILGGGKPSGLVFEAFSVPHRPISVKEGPFKEELEGDTVGYRIEDENGRVLVYVPDIREVTALALRKMDEADVIIFDGTFYRNDELIKLGISSKTSEELGHIPIAGPNGSIEMLRDLNVKQKFYTHFNNTNPLIPEDSVERRLLRVEGFHVVSDGDVIDL